MGVLIHAITDIAVTPILRIIAMGTNATTDAIRDIEAIAIPGATNAAIKDGAPFDACAVPCVADIITRR